jgi:hypothetical protein
MQGLTPDEATAMAKGYGVRFDDYVECPGYEVSLPVEQHLRLVEFCRPYLRRGYEVQGALSFHDEGSGPVVEKVYCMGGDSSSLRTSCLLDDKDMLRQMQADYPEMTEFLTNRVAWWHLHPGYYGRVSLSVGDVEETRQMFRNVGFGDPDAEISVFHLLVYGDPATETFEIGGYFIWPRVVYRMPVKLAEAARVR